MNNLSVIWREIARHPEIEEATRRVGELIAAELPHRLLLVRRIDLERSRLDTFGVSGHAPHGLPARRDLSPAELTSLLPFLRTGRPALLAEPLRSVVVPDGIVGEALAIPLADPEPVGVVVLAGPGVGAWVEPAAALSEPFIAALANDRRTHELARLREAAEADNRALLSRLSRQDITDTIVGSQAGLRGVMERVERVARTDAPVLIIGETGSGKEVVARAIHDQSRRSRGPFLRVNCGAIPTELVDSELFGHEKGSFTGAVATRKGWFERADGGTLFLDELGELPQAAQVRLLRVLQDGSFERVGGQQSLTVDVRIVAATHRDMHRMVADGSFREDLWYRVGVFPIRLPPLRERVEDIGALAAHFANRAGLRLHGVPLSVDRDDVALLIQYEWPGNVRELAAVIERAAILGDGKGLDVAAALGGGLGPRLRPGGPGRDAHGDDSTLESTMARHIEDALRRTRGKVEGPHGAAKILGVNPATLRSRMRKFGIDWSRFRGL